jgi:hypothetical protein
MNNLIWLSSPQDANKLGTFGFHLTQFTSEPCAFSFVTIQMNEGEVEVEEVEVEVETIDPKPPVLLPPNSSSLKIRMASSPAPVAIKPPEEKGEEGKEGDVEEVEEGEEEKEGDQSTL